MNFNGSSKQSACISWKYPYEGTPNDLHFYIPFYLKAFTFTPAYCHPRNNIHRYTHWSLEDERVMG